MKKPPLFLQKNLREKPNLKNKMLGDYLISSQTKFFEYANTLSDWSIGKSVKFYNQSNDLSKIDIAIIGLDEYRGSSNPDSKFLKVDDFRKKLYSLYIGDWSVNLIDMGNVKKGNEIHDTFFAVEFISKTLLEKNIIPFFIGGSKDLTIPIFSSIKKIKNKINLTSVDNRFNVGLISKKINDQTFMSNLILDSESPLENYTNIGYQTFLNSQEEIDLMEKMQFDYHRLGKVLTNIGIVEPLLRDSDMVTLDFNSIKSSDIEFAHSNPNGFGSENMCAISRYSGLSNRISALGIFNIPDNNTSCNLLSQLVWYFIEGFSLRFDENPESKVFRGKTYHVAIMDHDFKFYESEMSQKWWFTIQNKNEIGSLISCSKKDYLDACNQIFSERILLSLKRNFV